PRHAQHVPERGEDDLRAARDRMGTVDHLERGDADRAARSVHELDGRGQHAVDAVADDRMRLSSADLHQHPRPRRGGGDLTRQGGGEVAVAVLVEVPHGGSRSAVSSAVCPISSRTRYARAASSRSIREMAKPTCTSTYSPTPASGT